jgi:hypothetical protein
MLKYAKNGMFEAIINHENETAVRWMTLTTTCC